MLVISEQNDFAKMLLPKQKLYSTKSYRMNTFVMQKEHNNGVLLKNFITGQLVYLSADEYDANTYGEEDIKSFLIENWFLVPEDNNDQSVYELFKSFTRQRPKSKKVSYFKILTTTDCNARCFYCYQHGAKKNSMSLQTADALCDYIIKKSNGEVIKICWFGGEPTYNMPVIDYISKKLLDNNVEYTSEMLSNAYLFDKDIVKKSVNLWHLTNIQIVLDGTEEIYNSVKAYVYKEDVNPFKKVISNIKYLIENKVSVTIRMNMDWHNEQNLFALVDYIKENIGPSAHLNVYAYPLFDNAGKNKHQAIAEEKERLCKRVLKLEKYLYDSHLKLIKPISNKIKYSACLADNDSCLVVLPDGKIVKCDNCLDRDFIGDIYSDIDTDNPIMKKWKTYKDKGELCKSCPIRPNCFVLDSCPTESFLPCVPSEQALKIMRREWAMLKAYQVFTEKSQNGGIK